MQLSAETRKNLAANSDFQAFLKSIKEDRDAMVEHVLTLPASPNIGIMFEMTRGRINQLDDIIGLFASGNTQQEK